MKESKQTKTAYIHVLAGSFNRTTRRLQLQGVQLLCHLLHPATIHQLMKVQRWPLCTQTHYRTCAQSLIINHYFCT